MTVEERLDRLTGIVESLAASVVGHDDQIESHDDQIEKLIQIADKHNKDIDRLFQASDKHKEEMAEIRRSQAESARLFEAYLRRLPPQ